MACGATLSLKRAMALDPVQSPKRRRCGPAPPSPSSSSSSFSSSSLASAKTRSAAWALETSRGLNPSPFADVSPRLTAEQLVASIRQEFRRLQRRKHLDPAAFVSPARPPPSPPSPPPSPPSEQMEAGSPPPHADTGPVSVSPCPRVSVSPRRDSPLLTLRQVALICERALRERDEALRGEYEGLLTAKLSEQYDAFVKFNHDQILRRYGERPASYVS